jgi:hypothetical protein
MFFSLAGCKEREKEANNTFVEETNEDIKGSAQQSFEETETTKYFTVQFLNYDSTMLDEILVKEGEEATYVKDEPTKPSDNEFTYVFIGWDIELTDIQKDMVATAQFEAKAIIDWDEIEWF